MPKILYLLCGIIIVSVVVSVLGAAADEVSTELQSDNETVLKVALSCGAFSGEIVPIALTPQQQPHIVYKFGSNASKGDFSGQIVPISINPQTVPLAPLVIGRLNTQSL